VRPGSIAGSGSAAEAGGLGGLAAAGGRGTAPESTTPFQANANGGGGNRELANKALEAAGQVFDLLQNVVDLATGGGNDDDDDNNNDVAKNWRPSTTTLPQGLKPTQVASTSDGATNANANYILSQNNETYTFLSDPRLMSKDVVAEMANSSSPRLKPEQNLFTPSEYRMFLNDPICFYANIESMYLDAFSSSSSTGEVSTASPTPTPTQSLQRRQLHVDEEADEDAELASMCSNASEPNVLCPSSSDSPKWTSSQASISSLWASGLPDQLWSAHFATPATTSGDVTATATSTTSCSGLNGRKGPVTQYRELKMRETSGSDDAAATTPTGGMTSDAARTGEKCGFVYGLVGAVVAAVGLLVL
jgi:hypothetical protein